MKYAFSLIELIFAILIIAIISSVAVPKFFNYTNKALTSTIEQDVRTITASIQSHYMMNGSIDKISDSVQINKKYWSIEDTKVTFNDNEKECITIELVSNTIILTINKDNSTLCTDLYTKGIENEVINLIQ